MDIISILDKKLCKVDFKAKNKNDALKYFAKRFSKNSSLSSYSVDEIYNKLKEREDQGSTGFGNEIAIPHARLKGLDDFVLFIAASNKGVDFDSLDKKKVKLFFVLLGPDKKVDDHIKILASISRIVSAAGSKNELLKSPSKTALTESFLRHSKISESGSSSKSRKMKLMYVVLYIDEFLYNILEFFLQEGVEGATVIESYGMGQYISNIPMFAEFIGFMKENKNQSKTIMALIPEEKEKEIIEGIEDITGNLDKKDGALVMTMDLSFFKGSMKML